MARFASLSTLALVLAGTLANAPAFAQDVRITIEGDATVVVNGADIPSLAKKPHGGFIHVLPNGKPMVHPFFAPGVKPGYGHNEQMHPGVKPDHNEQVHPGVKPNAPTDQDRPVVKPGKPYGQFLPGGDKPTMPQWPNKPGDRVEQDGKPTHGHAPREHNEEREHNEQHGHRTMDNAQDNSFDLNGRIPTPPSVTTTELPNTPQTNETGLSDPQEQSIGRTTGTPGSRNGNNTRTSNNADTPAALCDADALDGIVGGPIPSANELREQGIAQTVRVLTPGSAYTLDNRRDRATIIIDAARNVQDAYCG